jgi:hypothetical protein
LNERGSGGDPSTALGMTERGGWYLHSGYWVGMIEKIVKDII